MMMMVMMLMLMMMIILQRLINDDFDDDNNSSYDSDLKNYIIIIITIIIFVIYNFYIGTKRAPFFLCSEINENYRPTGLFFSIYFNSFECYQILLHHNANQLLNIWLSDVKENNKDMKLIELYQQQQQQINNIDNNNNYQTNNNNSNSSSSNDNNRRNSNFNGISNSRNINNNEDLKNMTIFNFRKFLSIIYYKNIYRFTDNMIINKIRNWKEIVKKSCKRFIYLIDVKKIGTSSVSSSSSNYVYHTTDELDMIINEYEMKMNIDLLNNNDDDGEEENDKDDNNDESNEKDVDVININNNKTKYTNDNDKSNDNDNTTTNNNMMMKKDKSLAKEYNRLIPRMNRLVSWRDHCLVTKIESEPTTIQIMKTVEVPAITLQPISIKGGGRGGGRRSSVMDVFDDDNEEDKCKLYI